MFLENLLFYQLNAFQAVPSLFPSPFLITSRLQAIFVKLFKIKFDVAKGTRLGAEGCMFVSCHSAEFAIL
jgi:hypothetical protein